MTTRWSQRANVVIFSISLVCLHVRFWSFGASLAGNDDIPSEDGWNQLRAEHRCCEASSRSNAKILVWSLKESINQVLLPKLSTISGSFSSIQVEVYSRLLFRHRWHQFEANVSQYFKSPLSEISVVIESWSSWLLADVVWAAWPENLAIVNVSAVWKF